MRILLAILWLSSTANAKDRLFLPLESCHEKKRDRPAALSDGANDVATVARALTQLNCFFVLVPEELLSRRVSVSLAGARDGYDKISRGGDALYKDGIYRQHAILYSITSKEPQQPVVDDDAVLILPPPGCTTDKPPRWHLEGKVALRALGVELAALTCERVGISRALAPRKVLFSIDANTPNRDLIQRRAFSSLEAHGLFFFRIFGDTLTTTPPPPPAPAASPEAAAEPIAVDPELDAGIHCSANHCRVSRKLRDRVFPPAQSLPPKEMRVVPAIRDGRPIGIKLFSIRPLSITSRLGLANGDTVLSANDLPLADPSKLLGIYDQLRVAPKIKLAIERRGAPLTLEIEFVD